MHALQSHFQNVRAYLTPLASATTFRQTGQLTVEEFLLAGDYLVHRFPTWEWSAGESSSSSSAAVKKDWIDGGGSRQFLLSRGVPTLGVLPTAAADGVGQSEDQSGDAPTGVFHDEEQLDDDWIATHIDIAPKNEVIRDLDVEDGPVIALSQDLAHTDLEETPDLDDIREIDDDDDDDDLAGGVVEPEDPQRLIHHDDADNVLPTRSYDLYISYDRYYRVPRLWLKPFGPTSSGGSRSSARRRLPLPPLAALDDIVSDYAKKTVTIEQFPWSASTTGLMASVHPCRHAATMKRLLDGFARRAEADELKPGGERPHAAPLGKIDETLQGGLGVHQYLVVFLKFMASISTIDLDATASI